MLAAIQRRMIIWTSVLVTILGIVMVLLMLEPPRTFSKESRIRNSAKNGPIFSDNQIKSGRQPASVPVMDPSLPDLTSDTWQAIDLELSCDEEPMIRYPKNVRQVRVIGHLCGRKERITETEVFNDANEFSVSTFSLGPQSFTTDYIALEAGDNKFRVQHRLENGEVIERQWVVHRQNE